jgi:hypothetical protein
MTKLLTVIRLFPRLTATQRRCRNLQNGETDETVVYARRMKISQLINTLLNAS